MVSQWENFLQNLGEWHGSFTQISPRGEVLQDTPSIISLEGLNDNKTVRLKLRRFSPNPSGVGETGSERTCSRISSFGTRYPIF